MLKKIIYSLFVIFMFTKEIQAQQGDLTGVSTYTTIGGNFRTRSSNCRTGFGLRCLKARTTKIVFDITISNKGANLNRKDDNMAGVIRIIDENTAQLIIDKEIGISSDFYKEVMGDGYFNIEQGESLPQEVLDILDYKSDFPIKSGKFPVQQDKDGVYLIITLKKG